MKNHFEDVWEEAESIDIMSSEQAIDSVVLKLNLYKSLLDKDKEYKERLFGEILFDLTKLSKSENINVYKCLKAINKNKVLELVRG